MIEYTNEKAPNKIVFYKDDGRLAANTMKLEPSDEVLKELYRLRAENEKLRETCQNIKIMFETKWSWSSQHKIDIACRDIAAALKETGDE